MEVQEELMPCPFCGSDGDELEVASEEFQCKHKVTVFFIHCKDCDAKGPVTELSGVTGAIVLWNTREDSRS